MDTETAVAALRANEIKLLKMSDFHFFAADNWTTLGVDNKAELKVPFTWGYANASFLPFVFFYALVWFAVNTMVAMNCWTSHQEGIKRRRLVNVTTSLIHSAISGIYLLVFFLLNTRLMFGSPLHYWSDFDAHIIILSIGYFLYDAFDLLINDKISISTGVLLFHHTASIFVLSSAILSQKFLLYAYWAMLMEMSSIFLHTRSILHISKLSSTSMIGFSKVVAWFNLIFFIVFRFFVQVFLVGWAWENLDRMHFGFSCIAFGGGICFFIINAGLFLRILSSDGFLLSSVVSQDRLDALLEDNEYSNSNENIANSEKKELLDV